VPKLTLARLSDPAPGAVYPDPALPGLRYQGRARGRLTAQLRFKEPGKGWQSHGLGYVDVHDRIADLIDEITERDEHGDLFLPHHPTLDEVLEPIRAKARELRRRLRTGEAPREGGLLFAAVAEDYQRRGFPNAGKPKKLAPRTIEEYSRQLARLKGAWQGRRIADIRKADVLSVLDKLVDDGKPVEANRTYALARKLFGWAAGRDIISASPVADIAAPSEETPRERTLTDDEIRQLWQAFDGFGHPFGSWAKLQLLTAARREQAATMRWEDIDGLDGPEPVWRCRQKGDKPLLVPLAPMAASLLRGLRADEGEPGEFVFSTKPRKGRGEHKDDKREDATISGYSYAKRLLDMKVAKARAEAAGETITVPDSVRGLKGRARDLAVYELHRPWMLPEWDWHDLRRTVRTNLSRLRVAPHVAELVLGHAVTGLIKVYDLWDYADEKRDALERWETHLAAVLAGGNVVPMPAARGAA
jgi:integrase